MIVSLVAIAAMTILGLYQQTRLLKAEVRKLERYQGVAEANMSYYKGYADKYDRLLAVLVAGGRRNGDVTEGEAAISRFVMLAKASADAQGIEGITKHYAELRAALSQLPLTIAKIGTIQ